MTVLHESPTQTHDFARCARLVVKLSTRTEGFTGGIGRRSRRAGIASGVFQETLVEFESFAIYDVPWRRYAFRQDGRNHTESTRLSRHTGSASL